MVMSSLHDLQVAFVGAMTVRFNSLRPGDSAAAPQCMLVTWYGEPGKVPGGELKPAETPERQSHEDTVSMAIAQTTKFEYVTLSQGEDVYNLI